MDYGRGRSAKWLGDPYTITFDPQEGTVEPVRQQKRYGSTYGIDLNGQPEPLPIPVREGYTFMGWYDQPDGQGIHVTDDAIVSTMADHTLYAHWVVSTYNIIFDSMGGTEVGSQTVVHGNKATEPEEPERTGYTFIGWYENPEEQSTAFDFSAPVTKDTILYAKWQINTYTLTYTAGSGGSISGASSQTVDHGANGTTVTATPDEGYHFVQWSDGNPNATRTDVNVTGNLDVTAEFALNRYTVSFKSNGGSSVENQAVNHGDTAIEPEEPTLKGYTFAGWYSDVALTMLFDFGTPITEDKTLYAKWSINQYTVTYGGNGSDDGSVPAPVTQDYDTDITVLDNTGNLTRTGHTFAGWNTEADGSGTSYQASDTFRLGAHDVTLYAQWQKNSYTVSFVSNGGTSVDSQTVLFEDKATEPTAPIQTGHTFAGWYSDVALTLLFDFGTSITEDKTLYAKWSINQYTVTYDGNGHDGGNVPVSVTQDYDTVVTVSGNTGNLTKIGHTFAGWNTAADGSGTNYQAGDAFGLGADNVTLYAQWILNPPNTAPEIYASVAGDTHVSISWHGVPQANGYRVYQSTLSGSYDYPIATVTDAVYGTYSYQSTGLTNGTTYYFVVTAYNESGESHFSNEVSATPQVPSPGAPVLHPPVAGNVRVSLAWDPVQGATAYSIYHSQTAGNYGAATATVTGDVYQHDLTGLINGSTYFFVVKAENPRGLSAASNEVSAIPMTVPEAPTGVHAVAGHGTATISFNEPSD